MRAREFTINIPINIRINGDGDPEISVDNDQTKPQDDEDLASNFVPPLQQKIELMKAATGKEGKIIDQIVSDDDGLS